MGRQSELALGRDLLARLMSGSGAIMLVEGEPGIGKTRLVMELLSYARALRARTVLAEAREIQRSLAYAPLADALRQLDDPQRPSGSELGFLLARRAEVPHEDLRFLILDSIATILERLSTEQPTVLAIEDLHWADVGTLLVLERLSHRIGTLPMVIVATLRSRYGSHELDHLVEVLEANGCRRLVLAPLSPDDVAALVGQLHGGPPTPALLDVVSRAAGNPLYVTELVRAYSAVGRSPARPAGLPSSLRPLLLDHLGVLSSNCRDLLRLASVLGSAFEAAELSALSGRSVADLLGALREALEMQVLRDEGERLAFRHDLIREALYGDIPQAARVALHREAASALAAAGSPAADVARHLLHGAQPGDAEAVAWLRRAAREVSPKLPQIAVSLLERALEIAGVGYEDLLALRAETACALVRCGRWPEGERLAAQVLATSPQGPVARTLRTALAMARAHRGCAMPPDELIAAAAEPDASDVERAQLMSVALRASVQRGHLRQVAAMSEEAVALAERAGEGWSLRSALFTSALAQFIRGHVGESVGLARRAVARCSPAGYTGYGGDEPFFALAIGLSHQGRPMEAIEAFREGLARAELSGDVASLALLNRMLGVARFQLAMLDDAEAAFEAAVSLWADVDSGWACSDHAWLGRIAVHRGELAEAERRVVQAEELLEIADHQAVNVPIVMLSRALLTEARGDPGGALSALEVGCAAVERYDSLLYALRIGPDLVRLATARGDMGTARSMVALAGEAAARAGPGPLGAQALRCTGMLARDPRPILEASADLVGAGQTFDGAAAAAEAASVLISLERRTEAVAPLRAALSTWETAGAALDADRAIRWLRAAGVRRPQEPRQKRPRSGWSSLTSTERQIVDHVVDGLTYKDIAGRMFVSRRTVETHVAHVFTKLGLRSRAELAAFVAGRSNRASTGGGAGGAGPNP